MKKVPFYLIAGVLTLSACNSSKTEEKQAKELKTIDVDYISKTVLPTDDFFLFANENWLNNNPVPASESRWGSFNELEEENNKKLTVILEDFKKSGGKKGSKEQLLGDFYASFLNMDARNNNGIAPIKEELDLIQKMNSKADLTKVLASLHSIGIGGFFGLGVTQDMYEVDINKTYFGQAGIGLPNRDYYKDATKADIREAYKKHIASAFKLAKLKDEQSAEKAVESIYRIEDKLASAMWTTEEERMPELTYNPYSKAQLVKDLKTMDFEAYLKGIGSLQFDSLVVDNKKFIKQVDKVMAEESLESIKDYLTWNVINTFMGELGQEFVDLDFNFHGKVLSGKKEMKPANERAIEYITHNSIGELLGKAFVDKHFSKEAQERVNEMVDNLKAVYKERIENLSWMSAETKKQAVEKLNSFGRKLGFPSKWNDFSSLNFKSDTYIANLKEMAKYDHKRNMKKLSEKVDRDEWEMPAHMVNAYYHPLLNEIAFPAGIMQPPFFDNDAEDAVNYGRIGMVIGHEFTHGFDDMGSKFAADGSFKNWWTKSDRDAFEAKTKVFGETFSQFCPFDGHCVNPGMTMGENIADLGGLTMAYHAYTRTAEFKKGEKRAGYTPAQRFFISYAQLWKINYTDAELKKRLATDPHSPGMYRINGPLKNCPEFFEAFNVKEGDKMRNSKDKVAIIW